MSLPKDVQAGEVNLVLAIGLLSLPRELGTHPDTNQAIYANIGRYGPYVQHGSTFASLTKDDNVLGVDLDRALELISKKEAKSKPLRILGAHPESGDPVEIWEGRYGPYVKHGKSNASLPKDRAPEAVTMDEAIALLLEKADSKGKGKSKGRGKAKTKGKTKGKARGSKVS